MGEVIIIGVDLAKSVFQLHAAGADGTVVFRRKLRRSQVLPFFAEQPVCTVAMEACASAHHWARAIGAFGHDVKLDLNSWWSIFRSGPLISLAFLPIWGQIEIKSWCHASS